MRSGERVMWECEICGRWFFNNCWSHKIKTSGRGKKKRTTRTLKFNKHSMATDHIEPVIPVAEGFTTWETYIQRLFNGRVQYICNYEGEIDGQISCHYKKTAEENSERKRK
jgi:hypothetical protein